MLLRLTLILFCWICAILPAEAKRVALVVGNSQYKSFSILPNPVNDARLMEKALRESGFEVTLILDADQAQMKRALLDFGRTLRKGVDASMFFYAGHGVQVKGENYLIPTDAELESEDEVGVETINVNAFLQTMESTKSPFNIIVLDACRNNPLSAHRGQGGGLAPVQAPKGSFVAYSTAAGKVALDGEGVNNSPYTLALTETLAVPGMRLEDVFKKTRERVLAATDGEQVPYESTSIVGDFYFRDAPAVAQQTLAVPGMRLENVFKKTRERVLAATDGEQVPYESTSIVGDFYFRDAPAVAQPVLVTPVVPSTDPIAADFESARTSESKMGWWDSFLARHGIFRGPENALLPLSVDGDEDLVPINQQLVMTQEKSSLLIQGPVGDKGPVVINQQLAMNQEKGSLPPLLPMRECSGLRTRVRGQFSCLSNFAQFSDCDGCPEMVVLPAGSFIMGSPIDEKGRKENEGPQHKVTLSKAFAVGKFEVSRGQYAEFVKNANYTGEKPCTVAKSTKEKGLQETSYKQTNDHPVVCVSWDDAQAYVKWLSKKSGFRYRLLTEAEWEYAARAGTTSAFSYGPTITTRQANFNDQIQATATVGSYSANAFGLFDMAGNVSEWTEDCYKDSYTHADGNGDAINVSGCQRVWRGGGWLSDLLNVRSAYRNRNLASQRNNLLGFRVARVL